MNNAMIDQVQITAADKLLKSGGTLIFVKK